jgi:hypothetical protein
MEQFTNVKDEYLPRNYPVRTAVGVTQLALPELRVEIRAVAMAGSSKGLIAAKDARNPEREMRT